MTVKWNLVTEMAQVAKTRVFSGGACNILDGEGNLLRSTERDRINDWLTAKGITFFDPQIHPDTHGREYDYDTDHKLEMAARDAAKINLYELSPRSFGGITCFEIATDHFRWREPMVIYFSDGNAGEDTLPAHSERGHPLFVPDGIRDNPKAMTAHYREFVKSANSLRKYLMAFAQELDTLTVGFSDNPARGDVVITPERMHATELFDAVARAAAHERVFVTFTGGEKARDVKGNPLLLAPEAPPEVEKAALLDQYLDEGNAVRRQIAELIAVSVYVRVVYTQDAAMQALGEVLKIAGVLE